MPAIEYICPTCGTRFTVDYDYVIPGVSGFINGTNGYKTFGNPDELHHCSKCTEVLIAQITIKGEKYEKR